MIRNQRTRHAVSLQKRRKSTWQNKNDFQCFPHQAAPAEHSWRGVLRGHVPSKSLSADSEIPCAMFWRTEKVGEKSDSFSRAERTRPLRPVSRLQLFDFENIPVECFQRILPLLNSRTRHNLFRLYASPERGDSPRGGEMPKGQRGPLSTRGTAVRRWRGALVKSFM